MRKILSVHCKKNRGEKTSSKSIWGGAEPQHICQETHQTGRIINATHIHSNHCLCNNICITSSHHLQWLKPWEHSKKTACKCFIAMKCPVVRDDEFFLDPRLWRKKKGVEKTRRARREHPLHLFPPPSAQQELFPRRVRFRNHKKMWFLESRNRKHTLGTPWQRARERAWKHHQHCLIENDTSMESPASLMARS